MNELLKVKLIDEDTEEVLISPSGKEHFGMYRLPSVGSEHIHMTPYSPQRYIVTKIKKPKDGLIEAHLKKVANEKGVVEMEERINELHTIIKELYPEAVSVEVFVNCEGINVNPQYRTNADGYSMRNIMGKWIKREKKE